MFGRISRFGFQASRRLSSVLSSQGAHQSQFGYAIAMGAAGAASIYLVRKHLSAEEMEGGVLYTWYVFIQLRDQITM